jgi:putative toxin-antitoxin system antitoxin component (TIGR02293 family)
MSQREEERAMQVSVESVLGLDETIRNDLDLIEIGAKGVKKQQIRHLGEAMCLPNTALAPLLAINVRTIQRQPEGKPFDRRVSDRAIKLARLTARGIEIFGNGVEFCAWLQTPSMALGDKTPLSLLVSIVGVDLVDDLIGRIEYGVYS